MPKRSARTGSKTAPPSTVRLDRPILRNSNGGQRRLPTHILEMAGSIDAIRQTLLSPVTLIPTMLAREERATVERAIRRDCLRLAANVPPVVDLRGPELQTLLRIAMSTHARALQIVDREVAATLARRSTMQRRERARHEWQPQSWYRQRRPTTGLIRRSRATSSALVARQPGAVEEPTDNRSSITTDGATSASTAPASISAA